MNKDFIIKQISALVESHKLWDEMAEHIFALGGELWESKYVETYAFHEGLVYDLIIMHRGYPTLDDGEFDCFQESIYDLAHGQTTGIFDVDTNEKVAEISSVEELYNWMMQPQEIFIPKEENLN
jgi:hypothetical protein